MAKRFTNEGSIICLFGWQIVDRGTVKDAKKRAAEANEKFASVNGEALCVKFFVPFTTYQEWLKNSS